MTKRKTDADYHALAERRGFRWLGPEVPNIRTKTTWGCEHGHQWEATYDKIGRGSGCPFCAGLAPKTPVDYQALAEDRGLRWLGPEAPNVRTKTTWECEQGHQWESAYDSIRRGSGCAFCAGLAPKTPVDYQALAEDRGFRWLGPEVPNTSTKTGWECGQGHCWEATFGNIQQAKGCPFCAGSVPKTADEYDALAEERGFRWLGPQVSSVHALTCWECDEGHTWEATYTNFRQGTGCPICIDMVQGQRVSQVQRDLCHILDGELNRPFERYNIDVALVRESVSIAVEYDAWYWHAGREESDARRDDEMIAAGWGVLRIRSNTQLPAREQLDAALDRLLAGEKRVEIVLDDWGVGPTRFEVD